MSALTIDLKKSGIKPYNIPIFVINRKILHKKRMPYPFL